MEYLLMLQDEGLVSVAGWCLMDNHVHLIVRAEPDHLTTVFKCLNIKYAMMYHREYKIVGHVFQDRFMSEPIETDVDELADRSGMSLRAIAKHIDVSFSTIQAIRKKK